MKKLILAVAVLASMMLIDTTPAPALGCTTGWVNGKISQICDSGVAVTLNNRGRSPAQRCREQRVFGTLKTVWVCN
jgi:hypothetical protein